MDNRILKAGQLIKYIPKEEYGFVVYPFWDGDSYYCRYWSDNKFNNLRTKSISELTPLSCIEEYNPPQFDRILVPSLMAEYKVYDDIQTIRVFINEGIERACKHVAGHEKRWEAVRQSKPNDDELLSIIGKEFGIYGGGSLPHGGNVEFKGGSNPIVTVNVFYREEQITGDRLLNYVREIMNIKKSNGQLSLF